MSARAQPAVTAPAAALPARDATAAPAATETPRQSFWLAAVAMAVIVFLQVPVLVVMLAAVSKTAYLTIPPKGLTLHWFQVVLQDPDYLSAGWTSLWLASASTAASLVLGLLAAYGIDRKMVPAAGALASLFMAPLIVPSVVLGVALLQYYTITGLRGSSIGLWLSHVVIIVPYVVRASLASLSSVDDALEDAALVLGANRFTSFRLVTLPLVKPGLVAGGLFSFITSLDNVPVSIFLLSASQTTLPVKIFTSVEQGVDPSVAAVSTMLIVLTGIALVVAERWTGFHKHV
jgi:putative spermidine/putrescine transport system permease protein